MPHTDSCYHVASVVSFSRSLPNCRMAPPGEFNGNVMSEPQPSPSIPTVSLRQLNRFHVMFLFSYIYLFIYYVDMVTSEKLKSNITTKHRASKSNTYSAIFFQVVNVKCKSHKALFHSSLIRNTTFDDTGCQVCFLGFYGTK